MNPLHPDLKRLLRWSRPETPGHCEEAPFGFATRVVASGRSGGSHDLLHCFQQVGRTLACASLAVIVSGGVLLISQLRAPAPTAVVASALSFLASKLPR